MTRAEPWMEIVWRIFLAAGCVQNARNRPAGLVLTLRDITADGAWARLTALQPDNFAATTILPFANMKISPGHQQPLFQSSTPVCLALVAGVLLSAGCGNAKKPAAETTAVTPEIVKPAATDHAPVYAPTPTPAAGSEPAPQNIHEMERVLVGWVIRNHHRPQSFEEFVASAEIQVPPPPSGKKYIIAKNMHIVLVDK